MDKNRNEIFTKSSLLEFPAERVFDWHHNPGALERYSPPWDPVELLKSDGGIEPGSRIVLKMKAGPFTYRWHAEHTEMKAGEFFTDEQLKGPFASWKHKHEFKPVDRNSSLLVDNIEYRFRMHALSRLLLGRTVKKKLENIFAYRHSLLEGDLASHSRSGFKNPGKIVISGSSGLIGSALVPFLTTAGHNVIRLVRRQPRPGSSESFWDPYNRIIDEEIINGADAVIHLSGDNIGSGRWSGKKKKLVLDSRIIPTEFISSTAARVKIPPGVFLSASAIGYYGDRGDEVLTEDSGAGSDFISGICRAWEGAASPSVERGIRTVFIRLGVVLTPAGGALKRLLLPFSMGAGGRIGSGEQYISWVAMDDVLSGILHLLGNKKISGPVNLVSPGSITNRELTGTLSSVLKRPAFLNLPEPLIMAVFGQMGREVLLGSARVRPEKLENSGYRFRHTGLEQALRYMLGRN